MSNVLTKVNTVLAKAMGKLGTADEIMRSFSDVITALDVVAEKASDKCDAYTDQAVELERLATEQATEVNKAKKFAKNIRKILED